MYIQNFGYLPEIGYRVSPSKVALIQDGDELTYAELEARANRVANALLASGIQKGERVALMQGNERHFVECFFGVMRAGAVAVPMNVRSGNDAMRYVLADSGSRILIASPDWHELAVQLAADIPTIRQVVLCGKDAVRSVAGRVSYDRWVADASAERVAVEIEFEDLCMMPYTSGTTGRPKGVRLHHAGQIHNAEILRRAHLISPDERTLISGPMYHANALSGAFYPFILGGASAVILPKFDPRAVIEAIERYACTHTIGVPTMFALMLRDHEFLKAHDVRSVNYLGVGSAPVTAEFLEQLQEAFGGVDVVEGYGMTESGPVPILIPRWGKKKLGSCGILLPEMEVRLVDEAGVDVGVDEIGETWIRNPGNARGYHNLPEVTAARFTPDGWLKSGDLMRRDAEGFYFFLGRKDDQISVGGENVYPKEVEAIVLQHPGVLEASVVPVPHALKGAVPVAFVVRREGHEVTEEQIKAFYLERGAAYAHPRRVFFVNEFPLSGTSKIDRKALERQAQESMTEQVA